MDIVKRLKKEGFDPFLSSKKVIKLVGSIMANAHIGQQWDVLKKTKEHVKRGLIMSQIKEKLSKSKEERDKAKAELKNIFEGQHIKYLGQIALLSKQELYNGRVQIKDSTVKTLYTAIARLKGSSIMGNIREELKSRVGAEPEGRGTGHIAQKFPEDEIEAINLLEKTYGVPCNLKIKERAVDHFQSSRFFNIRMTQKGITAYKGDFIQRGLIGEEKINNALNDVPELKNALRKTYESVTGVLRDNPDQPVEEHEVSENFSIEISDAGKQALNKLYSSHGYTIILAHMQQALSEEIIQDAIQRIPTPANE